MRGNKIPDAIGSITRVTANPCRTREKEFRIDNAKLPNHHHRKRETYKKARHARLESRDESIVVRRAFQDGEYL